MVCGDNSGNTLGFPNYSLVGTEVGGNHSLPNLRWQESQLAKISLGPNLSLPNLRWPESKLAIISLGPNLRWPESQLAKISLGPNLRWPESQLAIMRTFTERHPRRRMMQQPFQPLNRGLPLSPTTRSSLGWASSAVSWGAA